MACSIATLVVILGGVFTAGSPFLHVMRVIASLDHRICGAQQPDFQSPYSPSVLLVLRLGFRSGSIRSMLKWASKILSTRCL